MQEAPIGGTGVELILPSLNSCLRYCLVTSTWNTWYSQMKAAILERLCLPDPPIPTRSMLPLSWPITRMIRVTVGKTERIQRDLPTSSHAEKGKG